MTKSIKENEIKDSLIIIDSIRSFMTNKDVNSDKDAGVFMELMKQIRDCGNTVFLIHHTNKDKRVKNSTTFVDYSDTLFKIERANEGKETLEIAMTNETDRLGLKYRQSVIIDFDKHCLSMTDEDLEAKNDDTAVCIKEFLEEKSTPQKQNEIINYMNNDFDIKERKTRETLDKYTGILWNLEKGSFNSNLYRLIAYEKAQITDFKR